MSKKSETIWPHYIFGWVSEGWHSKRKFETPRIHLFKNKACVWSFSDVNDNHLWFLIWTSDTHSHKYSQKCTVAIATQGNTQCSRDSFSNHLPIWLIMSLCRWIGLDSPSLATPCACPGSGLSAVGTNTHTCTQAQTHTYCLGGWVQETGSRRMELGT